MRYIQKDTNAGQDFETRSGDNNKDFIDIKSVKSNSLSVHLVSI